MLVLESDFQTLEQVQQKHFPDDLGQSHNTIRIPLQQWPVVSGQWPVVSRTALAAILQLGCAGKP